MFIYGKTRTIQKQYLKQLFFVCQMIFAFLFAAKIFAHMKEDLPRTVVPSNYNLFLDVKDEHYLGTVRITVDAEDAVDVFHINSKELEIKHVQIEQNGETSAAEYSQKSEDLLEIKPSAALSKSFILEIEFSGKFGPNKMEGFYKSEYNGTPLFSTHFEPADARIAFPCFDQPDMKATYEISIRPPTGLIALSNNRLKSNEDGVYHFEKTVKMSTYIVAWVIGDLDYIEVVLNKERSDNESNDSSAKKLKENTMPIRVYAHKDEIELGRFSLDCAERCIQFFEKYFEIDYPLPKLDMVAIPSFAMGAMENWGLITYRATSLLYDPAKTSIRSKKNIAITVCHELAHMWFGNLVTMEWWSDLWLNEGFATWAATLAIVNSCQDILPFDAWTSFINDEMASGMGMDAIKSTHRIGIDVERPVEIDQIFDAISYSKGSSIIRMIEGWIGAETFRKGLVRYLKAHSYSNTKTIDLWESLSAAYGDENENNDIKNKISSENIINDVINPWIVEEGFPYLKISENNGFINLHQQRFTLGFEAEDAKWPIPVRIGWINEKNETFESETVIMVAAKMSVRMKSSRYIVNDGVFGFYRVLYSSEALETLLGNENLSTENRLGLFSDRFAFSKALMSEIPLKVVGSLKNENNYEILLGVLGDLQGFETIFVGTENEKKIREKLAEIVGERAAQIDLSSAGNDINSTSTSSLLVSKAVHLGDNAVISKFKNLLKSGEKLDVLLEVKGVAGEFMRQFYTAVADEAFEDLVEVYKQGKSHTQRQNALFALGTAAEQKHIAWLFDNLEFAKPHDAVYLFAALDSNIQHRKFILERFIKDFEKIRSHLNNANMMRYSIEGVFRNAVGEDVRSMALEYLSTLENDLELRSAVEKSRDSIVFKTKIREYYAKAEL
ncbi:puromycin-sensitive aminopeptidase [Enteropsectra breve]|nr:puromycin-sensitive aminopeptidase [Enteropsectra breve]